MSESTRGLLYRFALLGVILYALVARPDSLDQLVPIVLAILGNGLATLNTSVRR